MVSRNLKKSLPLLEAMSSIRDPRKRAAFLKLFEANLQRAIREVCFNLLNGNVNLTTEEKKRLQRFKKVLRALADSKTKKRKFNKIVSQTGRGFLPAIIPLVISAISSFV